MQAINNQVIMPQSGNVPDEGVRVYTSEGVKTNLERFSESEPISQYASEYNKFKKPIKLINLADYMPAVLEIIGANNPLGVAIIDAQVVTSRLSGSEILLVKLNITSKADEQQRLLYNGCDIDLTNRRIIKYGRREVIETTNDQIFPGENQIIDTANRLDMAGVGTGKNFFVHEKTPIKACVSGVLLEAYVYEGVFILCTRTKFITHNSRFGRISFTSMYFNGGGPDRDFLFDEKPFSDKFYTFCVVHPELLSGSKQLVFHPHVIFMYQGKMNTDKIPNEMIGRKNVQFNLLPPPTGPVSQPGLYHCHSFTPESANAFLMFGYYQDKDWSGVFDSRLLPGEALLVISKEKIYKVKSRGYDRGTNFRGSVPNHLYRFTKLIHGSRAMGNPIQNLLVNTKIPQSLIDIYMYQQTEANMDFISDMSECIEHYNDIVQNASKSEIRRAQDLLFLANYTFACNPAYVGELNLVYQNYLNGEVYIMEQIMRAKKDFDVEEIKAKIKAESYQFLLFVFDKIDSAMDRARVVEQDKAAKLGQNYQQISPEEMRVLADGLAELDVRNHCESLPPLDRYKIFGDIFKAIRRLYMEKSGVIVSDDQ